MSVNTRSRITQHGRPEEPARRAGDERLAFQVDQLLERLSTEMVRPVKRASVVLQVVSYVSSDLPLPTYLSLYLPPLLNSSACATVYASLDTLVITLYDRSWWDRMPRLGSAFSYFQRQSTSAPSHVEERNLETRQNAIWSCSLFAFRLCVCICDSTLFFSWLLPVKNSLATADRICIYLGKRVRGIAER